MNANRDRKNSLGVSSTEIRSAGIRDNISSGKNATSKNSTNHESYKKLWKQKHKRILSQILDGNQKTEALIKKSSDEKEEQKFLSQNSQLSHLGTDSSTNSDPVNSGPAWDNYVSHPATANLQRNKEERQGHQSISPVISSELQQVSDPTKSGQSGNPTHQRDFADIIKQLYIKEDDLVKPDQRRIDEAPIKLFGSLKDTIKETNQRFIETMEDNYEDEDPKSTPLAIKLAEVYIKGKRVPKNIKRAYEILDKSKLLEAKYLLLKLSIQLENHLAAYHFGKYFEVSKCTCGVINALSKTATQKPAPSDKNSAIYPNKVFALLEHNVAD